MSKKRYIVIFAVSIAIVIVAVCVYLAQLSNTVSSNLMATMNEISLHDVESIEGSLDNSYSRLDSVAKRMKVYDVEDVYEAQEQMNLEAASSALFNAIYLLDEDGALYSSSYLRLDASQHSYDEMFANGADRFVRLYNDANGKLETTKESLIYGIKVDGLAIGSHRIVAMLARSDLSIISEQLLIESFDGQGISSVVNAQGYYIVRASPATDLTGRDNFYDVLEAGRIDDGMTADDVRRNISEGERFTINVATAAGERLVMSFAPVEGTSWSLIMTVPMSVFEQHFATFMNMAIGMLVALVIVLIAMMAIIYHFMKDSLSAKADAAAHAEFLSNMSHEIRTPLNGIIGLNHLMEHHIDDRAAMEGYMHKLGKATRYLLSLVNDILDVSKLQAGKVKLTARPFDLAGAIDNVCEMQREAIDERGIAFDFQTDGLPYPYLIGDEVRLSQVLTNILANAAKFTPEGGTITFRASERLLDGGWRAGITISIADTGCGMSASFQKHIFDMFSQERDLNDDSQKGTGLGMAISHLLVEQMGGAIAVESELGRGSCFTVTVDLPLNPARASEMPRTAGAPADEPDEGAKAAPAAQLPRMKLLVAEDNELNADIISSILEEEGYSVVVATDGRAAVDAFAASEEGEFSAILMDAHMPVMDGYEAAREIRRLKRADAAAVRIFACTASTFTEDRARAIESGMDDFLAKPLDVRVMLEKLEGIGGEG